MFKPADIVKTKRYALWVAEDKPWGINGAKYEINPNLIFEVLDIVEQNSRLRVWCPSLKEFFAYVPADWFEKISR